MKPSKLRYSCYALAGMAIFLCILHLAPDPVFKTWWYKIACLVLVVPTALLARHYLPTKFLVLPFLLAALPLQAQHSYVNGPTNVSALYAFPPLNDTGNIYTEDANWTIQTGVNTGSGMGGNVGKEFFTLWDLPGTNCDWQGNPIMAGWSLAVTNFLLTCTNSDGAIQIIDYSIQSSSNLVNWEDEWYTITGYQSFPNGDTSQQATNYQFGIYDNDGRMIYQEFGPFSTLQMNVVGSEWTLFRKFPAFKIRFFRMVHNDPVVVETNQVSQGQSHSMLEGDGQNIVSNFYYPQGPDCFAAIIVIVIVVAILVWVAYNLVKVIYRLFEHPCKKDSDDP